MVFAAGAIAVLCLVSVSHSAPLACEELVRPLDHLDPLHLEGRWALIAGSHSLTADVLKERDSVAVDLHNSSYTQANNVGGQCEYHPHNMIFEGHTFTIKKGTFNSTGTFFHTSCQDCMVFTFDVASPTYKEMRFFMISRRREVDHTQVEEFRAQAECLKLPPPIEMSPSKELCPEQTAAKPAAKSEGNADGQQA